MTFTESPLSGVYVVDMVRLEDERGFFARSFCATEFAVHGIAHTMSQCSVSFNTRKATLRGLHFQAAPYQEDKLVRCTSGAVFDVVVDLRRRSSTFRSWYGIELTAENHRALYVPQGFAHGFVTLADASEVLYMMSVPHTAGSARGVRWNDPAFAIHWPIQPLVLSARDAEFPSFDASAAV